MMPERDDISYYRHPELGSGSCFWAIEESKILKQVQHDKFDPT